MSISWNLTYLDVLFWLGVVALVILILVARKFFKKKAAGVDREFVAKHWKQIDELASLGKEMNYKLAIIEADKLLDNTLQAMYFQGETMADRLRLASFKFPRLREVWWAHKVRNYVVHDMKYVVKAGETKKVLSLFKQALKELGAL